MRGGRVVVVAVAIALVACACGGGDDASAPTTRADRSTTTEVGGSASQTTATAASTTATTAPIRGELAAFLDLAEDVDASLGAVATRINATFPEPPDGLHGDLLAVAESLEALRDALPGGLDTDVEAAAILVYSDLDARLAALAAMDPLGELALTDPDELRACFANGSPAAREFVEDVTRLRELAVAPPVADAAAGGDLLDLEVRLATVGALNGAPRCGGFRATEVLAVDWVDGEGDERDGRVVLPDGTQLAFDVDLVDGRWSVTTHIDADANRPTGLDLAPFVREVDALDAALDSATAVLGDLAAPSLDPVSIERFRTELERLDFDAVDDAMPAGLPAELEAAVVLVYSDLVSRYTAYDNGIHEGMFDHESGEVIDDVLATAAAADAALAGDLAAMEQLAAAVPSDGGAAPGSRDAASLAVRRSFVWLANGGCAQTGGYRAVEPIAVDWLDAPITDEPVRVDGTVEDITFSAELDGDEWIVAIHAC